MINPSPHPKKIFDSQQNPQFTKAVLAERQSSHFWAGRENKILKGVGRGKIMPLRKGVHKILKNNYK